MESATELSMMFPWSEASPPKIPSLPPAPLRPPRAELEVAGGRKDPEAIGPDGPDAEKLLPPPPPPIMSPRLATASPAT